MKTHLTKVPMLTSLRASLRLVPTLAPVALVLVTSVFPNSAAAQDDGWRTIEIETTEVTSRAVAITPDGESLVFTLFGHLYRLPVEGGDAEQLTFGPHCDLFPSVSPDGTQVAFRSDRDGSEGNIFLLDLATGGDHSTD